MRNQNEIVAVMIGFAVLIGLIELVSYFFKRNPKRPCGDPACGGFPTDTPPAPKQPSPEAKALADLMESSSRWEIGSVNSNTAVVHDSNLGVISYGYVYKLNGSKWESLQLFNDDRVYMALKYKELFAKIERNQFAQLMAEKQQAEKPVGDKAKVETVVDDLKVGDLVLVSKPENVSEGPVWWVAGMESCDKQVMKINRVGGTCVNLDGNSVNLDGNSVNLDGNSVNLDGNSYIFHKKWLTKVEDGSTLTSVNRLD